MSRSYILLLVVIIVSSSIISTTHAFYDAFPTEEGPYVSGPASTALPWPGEDFESFSDGTIIETSTNKSMQSHLDVTSGTLESKYAGTWRRGWTDDYNFRAVAIGYDSQSREIKWTDQVAEYRGYISSWQTGANDYSGLHLFARYRTSDDLYVASIRHDGKATIKRKWNGTYTTLAWTYLDESYLDENDILATGQWYRIRFSAVGNDLDLYLDNTLILSTTCGTFSWGTTGIRTDYANVYLDDWSLIYSGGGVPEPTSAMCLGALTCVWLLRRR